MKKLYSLIKASMTNGMSLFKIKTKSKKSAILVPLFIGGYLMFMIWGSANTMFEKLYPMHLSYLLLPLFVISISFMTFIEGIYKTSSLIFNCSDDDLLLSLPIKRSTVLFVRIFKFYIFELLFNSLFLFPMMVAYIRWADQLNGTYFLTCLVMLLLLPIIPIALSCFFGAITASLSSRFKYKNFMQIAISMIFIMVILFASYQSESIFNYIMEHATSLNDFITKIYYPAGVFGKLVIDFHIKDLLIFIGIHLAIFVATIYLLSIFYFKINSRVKRVVTSTKTSMGDLKIQSRSQTGAMIHKELNTFFQTPVFIINSGFALVLFIVAVIGICFKFDSVLSVLTSKEAGFDLTKDFVMSHLSVFLFMLLSIGAYMTSITNCVISLEGRKINILKSLPIKVKTILMSKIYACMVLTTPVFVIGNIILSIRLRIPVLDSILLIVLSILIPLVSHFIGILINLKFPKLDADNPTQVVKQSTSSFTAVMLGMILCVASVFASFEMIDLLSSTLLLTMITVFYLLINGLLYYYLTHKGVIEFNQLSI